MTNQKVCQECVLAGQGDKARTWYQSSGATQWSSCHVGTCTPKVKTERACGVVFLEARGLGVRFLRYRKAAVFEGVVAVKYKGFHSLHGAS